MILHMCYSCAVKKAEDASIECKGCVKTTINDLENELSDASKGIDILIQNQEDVYTKGFKDGVSAFAWWKDGVEYVGSCGTTLKSVLGNLKSIISFNPPKKE